jgi:hypothetical protein
MLSTVQFVFLRVAARVSVELKLYGLLNSTPNDLEARDGEDDVGSRMLRPQPGRCHARHVTRPEPA